MRIRFLLSQSGMVLSSLKWMIFSSFRFFFNTLFVFRFCLFSVAFSLFVWQILDMFLSQLIGVVSLGFWCFSYMWVGSLSATICCVPRQFDSSPLFYCSSSSLPSNSAIYDFCRCWIYYLKFILKPNRHLIKVIKSAFTASLWGNLRRK